MAFDKIVNSAKLEAGLKQICDAVREKGGTSAQLAFPDAIAQAITAIEAGGGGDIEVKTGEYIPARTIDNEWIKIRTGVTKYKNLFCLWSVNDDVNTVTSYSVIFRGDSSAKYSSYTWTPGHNAMHGYVSGASTGSLVIFQTDDVGEGLFRAGVVYRWICVAGIPYNFINNV